MYIVCLEESDVLREKAPKVDSDQRNCTCLQPELNFYGDNIARKCGLIAFPRTVPL